jgi:hypothetical protein
MRWLLVLLCACDAASPDPGLEAMLQVEGAQFRPGPFPADAGGPATQAVQARHSELIVGRSGESVRGVLDANATGAVIGVDGFDGTWLLPASAPDLDTPGLATAKASIALSPDFPTGPFTLQIAASDANGRFGAAASQMLVANPEDEPTGELVIGLVWDSAADLDLHVVDPNNGEAWSDDPNTVVQPPPGTPVDPDAWKAGGILDHDGNKQCTREGNPREHVIWQMPPPSGRYTVRVDARQMCGDASTAWYVYAKRGDEVLAAARGVATPDDTLAQHSAGAGVLALTFTLP